MYKSGMGKVFATSEIGGEDLMKRCTGTGLKRFALVQNEHRLPLHFHDDIVFGGGAFLAGLQKHYGGGY
ncbi:hypothetical protein CVU37_05815 [candidate division BRC1 bacterium HGW-BRC1-1]|jgi:hypothetical protein|nr:MAG: hypothetical protein CVU37_05815 [candidate division BRC1 bacterium HGW-BRC1-1]